jgi:hypothetical protein
MSTHFVFNRCLLVLIQMHFDQLRTIQLNTDTFANNLSWEDEIVEDVVIHGGQCTATWALLFVGVWASALWLRQNFAFSTEDDMTSGEFLLQFTHQAGLDLLESLLLGDWNVNDDCLKSKQNVETSAVLISPSWYRTRPHGREKCRAREAAASNRSSSPAPRELGRFASQSHLAHRHRFSQSLLRSSAIRIRKWMSSSRSFAGIREKFRGHQLRLLSITSKLLSDFLDISISMSGEQQARLHVEINLFQQ